MPQNQGYGHKIILVDDEALTELGKALELGIKNFQL